MKKLILAFVMLFVMAFSASAWLGVYPNRIPIDCSEVAVGTPIAVNGSSGFTIDSEQQIVWAQCEPDLYLYYGSSDYAVAMNDTQRPMDVELGSIGSYSNTDVWDNYTLVWHLTENGTTVYDSTANGNNGTKAGVVYTTTTDTAFGEGQYCSAGDVSSIVSGAILSNTSYPRTREIWFKIQSTSVIAEGINGILHYDLSDGAEIGISYISDGALYAGSMGLGADTNLHQLIVTWDGSTGGLFYDGEYKLSQSQSPTATMDLVLLLCAKSLAEWNMEGMVDEARVFLGNATEEYVNDTFQNKLGTEGFGTLGVSESLPSPPGLNLTDSLIISPNGGETFNTSFIVPINFTLSYNGMNTSYELGYSSDGGVTNTTIISELQSLLKVAVGGYNCGFCGTAYTFTAQYGSKLTKLCATTKGACVGGSITNGSHLVVEDMNNSDLIIYNSTADGLVTVDDWSLSTLYCANISGGLTLVSGNQYRIREARGMDGHANFMGSYHYQSPVGSWDDPFFTSNQNGLCTVSAYVLQDPYPWDTAGLPDSSSYLAMVRANDYGFTGEGVWDASDSTFTIGCTPDWSSCNLYGSCNTSDQSPCIEASDSNGCGDAYGGDYSEFPAQICDYCTPDWSCSLFGICINHNQACLNVSDINTCYVQTNLSSDQFNGTLSIYSIGCGYNRTYTSGDIPTSVIDSGVSFAVAMLSVMGLIAVGVAGVFIARSIKRIGKK